MPIWEYSANRLARPSRNVSKMIAFWHRVKHEPRCAFCAEELRHLRDRPFPDRATLQNQELYLVALARAGRRKSSSAKGTEGPTVLPTSRQPLPNSHLSERSVRFCPVCGWWLAFEETIARSANLLQVNVYGGIGALKQMDLANVHAPMAEVKDYLTAKYASRFDVHPTLMEQTVGSVFRQLGFEVRVTGRSGDGGIDVILDGPSDMAIGVQVKRQKRAVKVEQIREFTGALVVNGLTRGIFVTTSSFQSGAATTVAKAACHGYRVELYDAARFYEALKLSQRRLYRSARDPNAPFTDSMPHIYQRTLRLAHE